MWLDKLKDLKKRSGMTTKQIAEKAKQPERTVTRILNGETYAPGIDKLRPRVYAMGGSLDDIFDESDFRVPTPEAQTLKSTVSELTDENVRLKDENVHLKAEIAELRLKLAHKEEIISLQDEIIRLHKAFNPIPKEMKF